MKTDNGSVEKPVPAPDKRSEKTKRMLIKSMCELAKEKPVYRITVQELAAKADISRGTFYLHYADIYDMYAAVETETLNNMYKYFQDHIDEFTDKAPDYFLLNIVRYVERDKELFRLLFSMQSFRNRLAACLNECCIKARCWSYGEEPDPLYRKSMTFYHIHGFLACVDMWLGDEDIHPEEELFELIRIFDDSFDNMAVKNCQKKQTKAGRALK